MFYQISKCLISLFKAHTYHPIPCHDNHIYPHTPYIIPQSHYLSNKPLYPVPAYSPTKLTAYRDAKSAISESISYVIEDKISTGLSTAIPVNKAVFPSLTDLILGLTQYGLNSQPVAPFGPPPAKNHPPILCPHPSPKSVCPLSTCVMWSIRNRHNASFKTCYYNLIA